MTLQERLVLLENLRQYLLSDAPEWLAAQERACRDNPWFLPSFVQAAIEAIAHGLLDPAALGQWLDEEGLSAALPASPKNLGLVMAGNIPLVGFHDFLCGFVCGHHLHIKTSSKDAVLLPHLVEKMKQWHPQLDPAIRFAETLKNADAYIATGSNNSGRYFEAYFAQYPHIIRKNRTSIAVLNGQESAADLAALADDALQYFGLGCRNVTQVLVPTGYDFLPLLEATKKYDYFLEHHKYKHNYDYHLALLMMAQRYYMNNGFLVMTEHNSPFSPVSQLHYRYYTDEADLSAILSSYGPDDLQCVVGQNGLAFGQAQKPGLSDYADGVNTLQFLLSL